MQSDINKSCSINENCFMEAFSILSHSVVLKFERCEHKNGDSVVDKDQEGVKC